MALTHFLGHNKQRDFYTDRAPEVLAAALCFPDGPDPHRASIPGVPQTNCIAESRVKTVIRGTRTLSLQAALPHEWWPYAPRCFAAIHNFVTDVTTAPLSAAETGEHLHRT